MNIILYITLVLGLCSREDAVAKELTYRVEAPVSVLLKNLLDHPDKPSVPDIVKDAELVFDAQLMPKRGYYVISIDLLSRYKIIDNFHKKLELWNKGDHTVVKSKVYLQAKQNQRFPLRWINNIKNRITNSVEDVILDMEKQKLIQLAEQLP